MSQIICPKQLIDINNKYKIMINSRSLSQISEIDTLRHPNGPKLDSIFHPSPAYRDDLIP
jgi:hypothetical protein